MPGKLPVAWERPAGGFEGFEAFEGGQTAGSNAIKNGVWLPELWPVALACGVRMPLLPVAWERPGGGFEGFEAFEGGQTAGSKTDGWGVWLPGLWPVALACGVRMPLLPVAWERLAGGFEGFEAVKNRLPVA